MNLTQPRFLWVAITFAAALATLAAIIVVATFVGGPSPAQAQQPICNGQPATIVGTGGDDTRDGTNNPDVIALLAGADESNGLAGADSMCGGPGDDTLFGTTQDDTLVGSAGSDDLNGEADNDTLRGGPGDDALDGGPGSDTCLGGPGNNTFVNCEQ